MKITKSDIYILKNWHTHDDGKKFKYKRFDPYHNAYEFTLIDDEDDYTIGILKRDLDTFLTRVYNSHVIETVSENYNV